LVSVISGAAVTGVVSPSLASPGVGSKVVLPRSRRVADLRHTRGHRIDDLHGEGDRAAGVEQEVADG
jgi:hypothetical protein